MKQHHDKVTDLLKKIKSQEMICRRCKIHSEIRKEKGQKAEKNHCLFECPTGRKIGQLGKELLAEQKERRLDRDARRWRDHRAKDQRDRA